MGRVAAPRPLERKPRTLEGGVGRRQRDAVGIVSRAVAAVAGGYVLSALATAVLARLLPGPVAEATMAATTFSFVIYVTVAIWAFADPKASRVWTGILGSGAVLSGILWLSLQLEPRL